MGIRRPTAWNHRDPSTGAMLLHRIIIMGGCRGRERRDGARRLSADWFGEEEKKTAGHPTAYILDNDFSDDYDGDSVFFFLLFFDTCSVLT